MATNTPMMEQYLRLKAAHPDAILFFHLGDFYEAFFEDAETLARELDVVLTSRNGNPMAGVPIRRGESYVNALLKRGYKVAICRQMEDPAKATGLVKREVVRVVTPGTALDDGVLDAGQNNYLGAVYRDGSGFGLAALDLSTGEFTATTAADRDTLTGELARLAPSETLLPPELKEELAGLVPGAVTVLPKQQFDPRRVSDGQFGLSEPALCAAGAVLAYVEETQKGLVAHIQRLRPYNLATRMDIDPFTMRNLELVKPLREGEDRGTLLHVLDKTATGMGRRYLRRAILAPLLDRDKIEARLDAVTTLAADEIVQQTLTAALANMHDLERLTGKLGAGRMGPLDLLLLEKSLDQLPEMARTLTAIDTLPPLLAAIAHDLSDPGITALQAAVSGMLVDQPPADARDGGLIRPGFDESLDRLHEEIRAIRAQISALEQKERARTGIPSLKVGYNRVFGYYIEVTKTHLAKVPPDYRRRQTLANAERFITDELKGYEQRIALAQERAVALELELFTQALDRMRAGIPLLQRAAHAVAKLDFLLSLAVVARRNRYVRPRFTDRHALTIKAGRHPVVELVEEFVPNNLALAEGTDVAIITGPNMSGKSVYLRQAALICLMAQIGSFVPAADAELPILDRIFARVGASDMLVSGISTFMMEMLETATILNRATAASLVILDEMGRGTSTYDGLSIAWAVAKELATHIRAKTLFATHYQELTRLADEIPNVSNLHVAVQEVGKEVVFLHRVEPGVAAGSYGVHVARLAGLPDRVTAQAEAVLAEFLAHAPGGPNPDRAAPTVPPVSLFGPEDHPVVKRLRKVDPNTLTPLAALELLFQLKEEL